MNLKFSWYFSCQLQDWFVRKKTFYPNLEDCISWLKYKFKRKSSNYELKKEDLEDIEMSYEFQTMR